MTFRSEQTRVLRRTIWWRTLAAFAGYTLLFLIIAFAFDSVVAPQIGNYIADSTSEWKYFSDEAYKAMSTEELLDEFLAEENNSVTSVVAFPNGYIDQVELASILSASDIDFVEYLIKAEQEANIATGLPGESLLEEGSGGAAARVGEVEGDPDEVPSDEAVLGTLLRADLIDGTVTLIPYSRQYLADQLLERDYAVAMKSGSSWVQESETYRTDGQGVLIHSFYARELGTYKIFRELKLPLLILLYLIGMLIIAFVSLSRISRYFDALTGGIASVLGDKTAPVELPRSLSIAQGELNSIRLQSLSDERAAQAAEARKDELVVYMAHDIRTPLTSIIGYLSLLDEAPDLPAEVRHRYISTTERKAEHLERLVEEFFEITKYNLQAIPIERRTVDVLLFFEQLTDEFYPQASTKGLRLTLEAPEDKSFFVDPDKLARALGNIMRNAISYADPNTEISVEVEELARAAHEASGHGKPHWKIRITDQGREIAPEHLESIFEKFYREDGSRGTKKGGTGLGLAIAKEIIVSHGGNVTASSEDGFTTFTVEI